MTKRKLDELFKSELALDRKASDFNLMPPRQKAGDLVNPFDLEDTAHASFELGTAAYAMRKPHIAIETTSLGLDALIEQQLALLDVRAAAYGMKGFFESGMPDAEEMIRLAPRATVGYRRAGELYSMQGYAKRALEVYQQGLGKVNDRHSWMLLDGSREAKACLENRVDFITNAPYDIVTNIMQYLTTKECISLFDVSKSWRTQISGCPAVWSTVEIDGYYDAPDNLYFLAYVSRHVTSIYLDCLKNLACEMVFYHIASGNFEKLEKIILNGCSFENVAGFFSAISHVSTTLKELNVNTFHGNGVQPVIPFNTVLATCRSLQSFKYRNQSCADDLRGYLGFPRTSTVTRLSLGINRTEVSDLADTLRFCPDLQHLNLYYFSSAKDLGIINQYCKNLVSFRFNYELHKEAASCIEAQQAGVDTGIRHMGLRIDEARNFMSLFTNHCTTVESMNLFVNPDATDLISLSMVGEFSNLEYLSFSYGGNQLSAFAARMISKAPKLRHIMFENCRIDGSVLGRDIASVATLEKLAIVSSKESDLVPVFDNIAAKGNAGTLKEVVLRNHIIFSAPLMESLTNIPTLRCIDLAYYSATKRTVDRFCARLKLLPYIEDIALTRINGIGDEALGHLSAINGLKRLELRSLDHITEDGLLGFDNSVTLVISDCKNLDDT